MLRASGVRHAAGALQSDIFELRDRGEEAGARREVAAEDRSIQVHACYSAMREVEVLHDRLLDMFERWPDLRPEQVLVAVTDLARYAPYVSGVFGAIGDGRRIPYDIVAEAAPAGDPQLEAFFDLREVPGLKKKPSTSELLDWLKLLLAEDIPAEALRSQDERKTLPPLAGALLKNEQDVHLFERLVFLSRHTR